VNKKVSVFLILALSLSAAGPAWAKKNKKFYDPSKPHNTEIQTEGRRGGGAPRAYLEWYDYKGVAMCGAFDVRDYRWLKQLSNWTCVDALGAEYHWYEYNGMGLCGMYAPELGHWAQNVDPVKCRYSEGSWLGVAQDKAGQWHCAEHTNGTNLFIQWRMEHKNPDCHGRG
jgi:hypothetical protein